MDEDVNIIEAPYYETTYLDDNNNKHITYMKDTRDLDFYKERFTVLRCEYKPA